MGEVENVYMHGIKL